MAPHGRSGGAFQHVRLAAACILWAALSALPAAAQDVAQTPADSRPAFDKTAYKGTVWSQANPWWLPNRSRTHADGGPDIAWHKYSDDGALMWKEVALRCKPYGLTGLQGEVLLPTAYADVWKDMARGFELAGNGFMLEPFITGGRGDADLDKMIDALMPELREHPNVFRLDGAPVIALYSVGGEPEAWRETIARIEAKHGRMIWLMDAAHADPERVRRYMPVFDGITMYGNWSEEGQREQFGRLTSVMHDEFPGKIFEGSVHTTYMVHFHYGGVAPRLTEKFRNSWDITLASQPDALSITNFFDCYENSRILPSYEMDDILLRISQDRIARWHGEAPAESAHPDLYVSNYTNVLLGQDLDFEVIGFPLSAEGKAVTVTLQVCDSAERVLHSFEPREMVLDALKVETFSLPSQDFADQRAVHPRLTYTWGGRTVTSYLLPATNLVTSLRPHMLAWCRSLDHVITIDTGRDWTLNDAGPGETAIWNSDLGIIRSHAFSQGMPGVTNRGGGWARILRNGREIESFYSWDLRFLHAIRLPDPKGALDWYSVELESRECRYTSPPIWVRSQARPGMVTLPIWCRTQGQVRDVEVEAARVPFFAYECDRDTGSLLVDSSGYEHHGYLGGTGYGGGHLARTGYRHEHKGLMPEKHEGWPKWSKDAGGAPYLRFAEGGFVMVQGGTAFPYASTCELSVMPERTGERMGIIGAADGQISLYLTEDGRIEASRLGARASEDGSAPDNGDRTVVKVLSQEAIPVGKWTRLAVVFDLRKLSLYVNGQLQGEAPLAPTRSAEWINAVVIGGGCGFPYTPRDFFTGGIRRVRIYGRNLAPEEFLQDDGATGGFAPLAP